MPSDEIANEVRAHRQHIANQQVRIHAEHADMTRRLAALVACCGTCRFWLPDHTCSRRTLNTDDEPNHRFGQRMAASYADMVKWCHEPIDVLLRGST